jgi:hypothetical protein
LLLLRARSYSPALAAIVVAIQKLHHAWGHDHRGNRFDLLHPSKEGIE